MPGLAIGSFVVCGIVVAVLLVVGIWLMGVYNGLARLRVAAQAAWSGIDVELKRRHDLIPNLVETVKGYASHESGTLEAVISARAKAVSAGGIDQKIAAEGELTQTLGRLMAIAEAYPDLKANTNFLQLQGELATTEDRIGRSRTGYNGAAGTFNTQVVIFPNNLIAGMFGFSKMAFFEVENAAERNAPQVKF
ncbi:MAG: LemA family protein [Planctomycetota bacterium]|nr:MAG: LemA family protein [Planctomycetota bacterium]RLS94523.1 MAG: LemA family protein [Planctomycetota bacterium]